MSRGRGQPFIAAPDGTVCGCSRSTARHERRSRRPLPPGLDRHRRPPHRGRIRCAERPGAHLDVLRPALRHRSRHRVARPDARRHSGRDRPVHARRRLRSREPDRRGRSRLEPQPSRRDPHRSRRRRARGPRQRRPRRRAAAQPADRHARRGADRPRLDEQVLARRRDEPAERSGRVVALGDREAARSQHRLLDGNGDHHRRCARPPLHGGRPPVPGRRREPEGRVDRGPARPDARRARVHRGGHALRGRGHPARGRVPSASTPPSARRTCSRRSRRW